MHLRQAALTRIALVACALVVTACGSSAKKRIDKSRGSFMAFSVCMRYHGVTNFPDPVAGGGIHLGPGIDVGSPSFRSAQATCKNLTPNGGPPDGKPSRSAVETSVKASECMRLHGVSGLPDPTAAASAATPSNLNPASYALIEDRDGVIIAIPKTIDVNSPVFQEAAKACRFS